MKRGMDGYRIVRADVGHVNALHAIERAAAALYDEADLPPALRDKTVAIEELQAAVKEGHLWVAVSSADDPVGFALASVFGDTVHLEEMDVHPNHARQGIGTALVNAVCDSAREHGFEAVTLTTFRHLAWNAPFYAQSGFVCLDDEEITPELHQRLQAEEDLGLDPAKRTGMLMRLT